VTKRAGLVQVTGALLLTVALGGCLGSADGPPGPNENPTTASGGTVAVGSGGEAAVGSGGEAAVGSGGTMTAEAWAAATAPRSGPHEVFTYDTCDDPHAGTTSVRVGPEYSIVPPLTYILPAELDPAVQISLLPYCTTSADCTEQPEGVCQGSIGDAFCHYAEPPPREACAEDAACTSKPNGKCVAPFDLKEFELCYPSGVCEDPGGTCEYEPPCTSDADCTAGAEGKCILPVQTFCRYDTCSEDADCTDGLRCGCGRCVEADCAADDDCPDGETCEIGPPFCLGDHSFHCSTPNDECTAGEADCRYQTPGGGYENYWGPGICTI